MTRKEVEVYYTNNILGKLFITNPRDLANSVYLARKLIHAGRCKLEYTNPKGIVVIITYSTRIIVQNILSNKWTLSNKQRNITLSKYLT